MRIAVNGSIPSREVAMPGPLVDCLVVVDENDNVELHGMSYEERHNSSFTGEMKTPQETIEKMPFNIRKIIARRAFLRLKPNTIVGIGLPGKVASVAAAEGMLDYISLSTDPGVFGGLPASGRNFGPAYNSTSLLEMNQMFDLNDGGGLDFCFVGAAEISQEGDVNVSRLSADRLTGPCGFIDIYSQSTRNICFMTTCTTKGSKAEGQDGKLKIESEEHVKKFVSGVFEKTFSGDEAVVRRGQTVLYVTERAVFRRSGNSDAIELIEIAPGVDLQRDVIDDMEFAPAISPNLKEMDPRIVKAETMHATSDFFGSLKEKCIYHDETHVMYLDLSGITLNTENDVEWLILGLRNILSPHVRFD
jgi:propionate CoA-transferase